MKAFYLGIDASKGYADFVILNQKKQTLVNNFQLDDTFEGHSQLYDIVNQFLTPRPEATLNGYVFFTKDCLSNPEIHPIRKWALKSSSGGMMIFCGFPAEVYCMGMANLSSILSYTP